MESSKQYKKDSEFRLAIGTMFCLVFFTNGFSEKRNICIYFIYFFILIGRSLLFNTYSNYPDIDIYFAISTVHRRYKKTILSDTKIVLYYSTHYFHYTFGMRTILMYMGFVVPTKNEKVLIINQIQWFEYTMQIFGCLTSLYSCIIPQLF